MTLRERWQAPDSYGLLLASILVSVIVSAASFDSIGGRVATILLLSGTLWFALKTSMIDPLLRRVAWILVAVAVAGSSIAGVGSDRLGRSVAAAAMATLVVAALAAILIRVAHHPTISFQTVLGALSMYLLLGLFYASTFSFLATSTGRAFFAQGAAAGTSVNYIYFSYVTVATVGYGDLKAAGDLGRMLAASEALVGQLFLVTVVALLVSNLGQVTRRGSAGERRDGPTPGD